MLNLKSWFFVAVIGVKIQIYRLRHVYKYKLTTRKGVPVHQGPALGCMSAIDKKSAYISFVKMYWSSSWARILNVQDIIKEKTKEIS